METWIIITIIGMTALVALYWGNVLSVKLPELDSRFDAKPFNCRPCLTFHLMWLFSMLFAFVLWTRELFVYGLAAAFLVFFAVKIIDNKKVTK
ncbi:hypothetical protein [Dysgonomonas reticulitermitis]